MGTHDRVFDIPGFDFLLQRKRLVPAAVTVAVIAFFVRLHRFQAGDFLTSGWRQRIIGGGGTGELSFAQRLAMGLVRISSA